MTDDTDTGPDTDTVEITIGKEADVSSVASAARALSHARQQRSTPTEASATAVEPKESPATVDAAPPATEAPGATKEADPAEEPSIEPPRSWTKEAKDRWQSLPRDTQEYLAQREQERDGEFRRSQNEAAEKLKGLTAKETAAEQARQKYETALPEVQRTIESQIGAQFPDVKTMADVERLATEDWPRFIQWQAAQMKLASVAQEAQLAKSRQDKDSSDKLASFIAEQDKLFLDKAPEMKDSTKAAALAKSARTMLESIGFTDTELGSLWSGSDKLSLRDHRTQLLIRDAARYRDAQAQVAKPLPKPVPQVQKPGVSRPAGAANADEVGALTKRLEQTGSVRDAVALLRARRAG